MKNKFLFLFFLGIFFIAFSVFAEEIGTTTEPEIGTTTEPEIGTTTEPEIFEPVFFEPVFFETGNEFLLLSGGGTIFEDDFNSYTDGGLAGQGEWTDGYFSSRYVVQGDVVKEGEKGISLTNSGRSQVIKVGSEIADGRIVVYLKFTSTSVGWLDFFLCEGSYSARKVGIYFVDGNITAYGAGGNLGTYEIDQWYLIEIEWRNSDKKVRYRINEGSWTDWVAPSSNWTSYLNMVLFDGEGGTGVSIYADYIAENPYSPPPPPEFNLDNAFFSYFFSFGNYLPVIFSFALVVVLVGSLLNFFLILDRKKTIE